MATTPTRGDVWRVDLGRVAKVRTCLVPSVPADDDNDRVLTTVVAREAGWRAVFSDIFWEGRPLAGVLLINATRNLDVPAG